MKQPSSLPGLRIAWTTVETSQAAEELARAITASRLAACVQVDGPIRSFYTWKGKTESAEEIRIWIKYPARNESALQELMNEVHPYDVPQWISVDAAAVGEDYVKWALSNTSQ